jgi:drug/metabolite transporter (DMT)-like permease
VPRTPPRVLALLFAVQFAFASLAVVGKVTVSAVPWQSLVLLRTAGAALVFGLLGVARGEPQLPPRGERLAMLRLGLLGVFINQALFLAGLRRTTAINATVLIATIPLFTAVFTVATGREAYRPRFALGTLIAVAGMGLVVRPERLALGGSHLAGDAMVVLNCCAYAVYLSLARDAIVRHGGTSVVRWAFYAGLLFAIPLGLRETLAAAPAWSPPVLASLAYILLVPTAFAYGANALALGRVPASVVSVFVYVQPVLASVMAVTVSAPLARWLGVVVAPETLTARSVAGALAVLVGVAVATLRASPTTRAEVTRA